MELELLMFRLLVEKKEKKGGKKKRGGGGMLVGASGASQANAPLSCILTAKCFLHRGRGRR